VAFSSTSLNQYPVSSLLVRELIRTGVMIVEGKGKL
jgi:hypothetical protein